MINISFKLYLVLLFLILISCQSVEILDKATLDYDNLPKITINAEKKIFKNLYEPQYIDPYIDHSLVNSPTDYLSKWINNNLIVFGTENKLEINIVEASLKKYEIENIDKKKYKEKIIFMFEINFLVEFLLYDGSSFLLSSSIVESKNTTTSGKFISLHENEKIIETLIIDSLIDFSKKSQELFKMHFDGYIL